MRVEQAVLDFDLVIVVAIDGREVEVPRRDLVVAVGPDGRTRGRYVLPESVLQQTPRCATLPPQHTPVATVGSRGTPR